MPTYDYVCDSCGYKFEAFHQMSGKPITLCPECNTEGLRRLIGSGAGIIFKGSGFYSNDYPKSLVPPGESKKKDTTPAE